VDRRWVWKTTAPVAEDLVEGRARVVVAAARKFGEIYRGFEAISRSSERPSSVMLGSSSVSYSATARLLGDAQRGGTGLRNVGEMSIEAFPFF
jgi:hypothetical protein